MNAPINGGGPTFPHPETAGMTLRDWFAGQVIGMILTSRSKEVSEAARQVNMPCVDFMARMAYTQADAMIKAREVKP